jgi:hypothetical protein
MLKMHGRDRIHGFSTVYLDTQNGKVDISLDIPYYGFEHTQVKQYTPEGKLIVSLYVPATKFTAETY